MQIQARVLLGKLGEIKVKKTGERLPKTTLKVLDIGPECGSDVSIYWIDFLGDAALDQMGIDSVAGGEFTIDIRSVRMTPKGERSFLNISAGAITTPDGRVVQPGLRDHQEKLAS